MKAILCLPDEGNLMNFGFEEVAPTRMRSPGHTSASPGTLLGMQIIGLYTRLTELVTLMVGPPNLRFTISPADLRHTKL